MSLFASLPTILRIFLLGLLVAGLLGRPVLVFAGEAHEAGHAGLQGDAAHAHDSDSGEASDPSDSENPWHVLMHFSHCCGQVPALPTFDKLGDISPAASDPLPLASVEFQRTTQPVALRPPIRA